MNGRSLSPINKMFPISKLLVFFSTQQLQVFLIPIYYSKWHPNLILIQLTLWSEGNQASMRNHRIVLLNHQVHLEQTKQKLRKANWFVSTFDTCVLRIAQFLTATAMAPESPKTWIKRLVAFFGYLKNDQNYNTDSASVECVEGIRRRKWNLTLHILTIK